MCSLLRELDLQKGQEAWSGNAYLQPQFAWHTQKSGVGQSLMLAKKKDHSREFRDLQKANNPTLQFQISTVSYWQNFVQKKNMLKLICSHTFTWDAKILILAK